MSARAFGIAALGDPDFVAAFRRGRSPRLSTVDRVLAFMGEPPAGPAFRAEVEAFLAVTGIKRSVLGSGATDNRSFVAHLREGVSPTLATVGRIRTWMAACASAEELKEVRNRAGAASAILAFERSPPPERPPRSGTDELRQERPADPRDGRAFVSTSEAADRLGLSPRTLDPPPTRGRRSTVSGVGCAIGAETWRHGRPLAAEFRFASARPDRVALAAGTARVGLAMRSGNGQNRGG